MIFVYIFGGFIICILTYLIVIIFFPVLKVKNQPLLRSKINSTTNAPDCRYNIEYTVNNEKIRSWLYLPKHRKSSVPCIILCNGFGGTKDMILEQYALKFVKEGWAALAIEYRHYGESDGTPRQLFSYQKQEEDIKYSIAYARSRSEIDKNKIFLWGTSAGGPHAINSAADDHNIAGVIAQCPGLDHQKDGNLVVKREGMGYLFGLIMHAQRDKGRSRFGLEPHTIPAIGKPGTLAMLNAPGAYEGYSSIVDEQSSFENRLCARIMLSPHGGNPIEKSKSIECPVLLLVCEKDTLVAPQSHEQVATNLGDKAQVISYPIDHFDIYKGEHFNKAIEAQISFIKKNIES